jgi:hypothetical protein
MAISYKNLAQGILQEISSKLETLDETQARHISKQLVAFYQFVTYQGTLPMPEEQDDNTMYLITLGVLMNHFLKNESPRIPEIQLPNGQ